MTRYSNIGSLSGKKNLSAVIHSSIDATLQFDAGCLHRLPDMKKCISASYASGTAVVLGFF